MSVHVFFAFSSGLSKPIVVPKGTLASITAHIESVEKTLGLKRTQYRDNPVHWDTSDPAYRAGFPDVDDETLCETIAEHNSWVRWLYDKFAQWAEDEVEHGEAITPDDARSFWHGLQLLTVRPERWTADYYRNRMEHFYEVMRGRQQEGVTFPGPKLSPRQAAAVVWLFDFLDPFDLRLDVPKGCDYLASSYDGGYDWCSRCGAVEPDYVNNCRKRGCPVQANWCDEDRPEWFRPSKGEQ